MKEKQLETKIKIKVITDAIIIARDLNKDCQCSHTRKESKTALKHIRIRFNSKLRYRSVEELAGSLTFAPSDTRACP